MSERLQFTPIWNYLGLVSSTCFSESPKQFDHSRLHIHCDSKFKFLNNEHFKNRRKNKWKIFQFKTKQIRQVWKTKMHDIATAKIKIIKFQKKKQQTFGLLKSKRLIRIFCKQNRWLAVWVLLISKEFIIKCVGSFSEPVSLCIIWIC